MLEILVRSVVDNLTDHRGEQASNLKAKLQELFGRVSARCSTDAQIWKQYARLYGDGNSNNVEDNEKVNFIFIIFLRFILGVFFLLYVTRRKVGKRGLGSGKVFEPGFELWTPVAQLRYISARCPQGYQHQLYLFLQELPWTVISIFSDLTQAKKDLLFSTVHQGFQANSVP